MTEEQIKILFAKNLKYYREKAGLSQMSLASKSGLATNFINDIENCKKWISPSTLSKLSEALNISPYKLFLEISIDTSSSNAQVNQLYAELSNELFSTIKDFAIRHV